MLPDSSAHEDSPVGAPERSDLGERMMTKARIDEIERTNDSLRALGRDLEREGAKLVRLVGELRTELGDRGDTGSELASENRSNSDDSGPGSPSLGREQAVREVSRLMLARGADRADVETWLHRTEAEGVSPPSER